MNEITSLKKTVRALFVINLIVSGWLIFYSGSAFYNENMKPGNNHYFVGRGILVTLDEETGILTAETKDSYQVDPNIEDCQIFQFINNLADIHEAGYIGFFNTGSIRKIPKTQPVSINGEERQIGMEYGYSKSLIEVNTDTNQVTVGGLPVTLDENKEIVGWYDVSVLWQNQGVYPNYYGPGEPSLEKSPYSKEETLQLLNDVRKARRIPDGCLLQ